MLYLILAESALEQVPREIIDHKSVISHAKRLDRDPRELLLDRSYHHKAMLRLKNAHKRGRPDLIHISLLSITSTPLYKQGLIELYLHTINDKVITLRNVRLPRHYNRFEGLMIDLFKKRRIVSKDMLMEVKDMRFKDIIDAIDAKMIIGLSRLGNCIDANTIARLDDVCIVIGGFPKGHFSNSIASNLDAIYSISKYPLDTHVVASRIVYEFEQRLIR